MNGKKQKLVILNDFQELSITRQSQHYFRHADIEYTKTKLQMLYRSRKCVM